MTNSTFVKVAMLGDDTDLAKKTKRAERNLEHLRKKLKKTNTSFRGLFKGLGFAAAIASIKKVAQAADKDNKSLANLAVVMHNLTGATADQVKAADAQIQKLQYAVGITDDELRPAFTNLLLPLQDSAKAMDALKLAADVSAGSGKSLAVVSKAMAKSFAGSQTALNKLIPGIAATADPMKFLADAFGGAAKSAAEISPFQRIGVIFQDIAEQLGKAFLPLLRQFADYLASPEGKKTLENFVQLIQVLANGIGQIIGFLSNLLGPLLKFIGFNYETADSLDVVTVALDSAERGAYKYSASLLAAQAAEEKRLKAAKEYAAKEKTRLEGLVSNIQDFAKQYREAIDFSMGLNEQGTRFRADRVIREMQKVLDFAKKLPAKLKALAKGGASKDTLASIAALGPTQGFAVASGLLESGQLSTFNRLSSQLGQAGQRVGTQAATGSYTININKANMSASEIVNAIKSYERKSGRKLLLNG